MKVRLDEAIAELNYGQALENWTFHDLRRTLTTRAQRLGVRLEVTEALLNHRGASRSGAAKHYHLHDWKMEKREALEKWGLFVRQAVAIAQGGNVTPLRA